MHPLRSARPASRPTVLVTLLVLACLAIATTASALQQVTLSTGHVDAIDVKLEDGAFVLRVNDQSAGGTAVVRDPADVLLHVTSDAEFVLPDSLPPEYRFLGDPGDTVWLLPQTQTDNPAVVWLGWASERLPAGSVTGDMQFHLDSLNGPGDLHLYQVAGTQPVRIFSSDDGLPDSTVLRQNAHVHGNWVFTAPGNYTLTFRVTGTAADGTPFSTGSIPYSFLVSGSGGTQPPPGGGPGPDPDPTEPDPDPTDPADPDPADPDPTDPTDPDPTDPTDPTAPDASIAAEDPRTAAIAIAGRRFPDSGSAPFAVLARDDVFADTLAASALTGGAPLLFTPADGLAPEVADELTRAVPAGQPVYLMGGENALSAAVAAQVQALGLQPRRLAGDSRIETAIAVADEVLALGGGEQVLLARAFGADDNPTSAWVDSVAAGAWAAHSAQPILLNPTDTMHPAVDAWLAAHAGVPRVLIGGEAALSAAVGSATGGQRVAGDNRYASAVAIAQQLWGAAAGEGVMVTSADRLDGWAFGLAAAGLGADTRAPLLMVETGRLPAETDQAIACVGSQRPPVRYIGGASVVSEAVRTALAGC